MTGSTTDLRGAYGFAVIDLPADAARYLAPVADDRPRLRIVRRPRMAERPVARWRPDDAVVRLIEEEHVELTRTPLRATFYLRSSAEDADLAHPYLAAAAGVTAPWLGYTAYHAGAIVGGDGAWLVAGTREAGKSTLLAHLALAGVTVLADDLSVIEDNLVHVGPRAIDLRAPTAARLAADGAELVPVRHAERRRLALGTAPVTAPLAGWLILEEGDELRAERVAPRDRPRVVTGQGYLVRPQGVPLLDAVTVPVVRLRRPKDWDAMDQVVTLVREHVGTA